MAPPGGVLLYTLAEADNELYATRPTDEDSTTSFYLLKKLLFLNFPFVRIFYVLKIVEVNFLFVARQ